MVQEREEQKMRGGDKMRKKGKKGEREGREQGRERNIKRER